MIEPALVLLDFSSIAAGIHAADEMIKRAELDVIKAGTVQPGRYLILAGGTVAEVEEALSAGREAGAGALLDDVFLPQVHPAVVDAIGGARLPQQQSSLGIIETATVAAAVHAADAGVKGALVDLVEIRMADGLGGKGIVLFSGLVADVEAAVDLGLSVLTKPNQLVYQIVIPQLHPAIWDNIAEATRFSTLVLERL
ncbi:MAG: BMC domain-containing protein [Anaerolineales bacterium]|nr:BMC domain-containing protein [Anaerolineales bacterium]